MEILNLSASALFDSLSRNNIDKSLLLNGTHLKLNYMLDIKKKHSWEEFVKMYENTALLLGRERAAREIAYHGLYNDGLATLRKIGTGLLDVKAIYWFMGKVACRHLFKDAVKFKYTKIKSTHVQMEIIISPELKNCPLLLETYTYLFENVPTLLGLPKAKVDTAITENKAVYSIKLIRSSYLLYLFSKFTRSMSGYTSAVALMEELESQSMQLSKLLEEKSELLRIMSHDISNVSVVVDLSLAKVLKSETLQDEDRAIISKAMKGSDRLRSILRDMQKLEIAHIRGVALEGVDVNQTFMSVEEYFRDQLALKGIHLVIQNTLPFGTLATAEKTSLEVNVMSNLLSNALKFSNAGSQINLETYLENGDVVITVTDFGVGMSPEELKNLFNKKLRKSTVGTSGEVGTGFGLGIVNTYVQLYGGKISAGQNFPKGTCVKISLPKHLPKFLDTIGTLEHNYYPSSTTRN